MKETDEIPTNFDHFELSEFTSMALTDMDSGVESTVTTSVS